MPTPVTKYLCEHRCGKNAVGSLFEMKRHEDSCWKNKNNATCKTCVNEIYKNSEEGFGFLTGGKYRGCKISAINETLDNVQHYLKYQNAAHARPIYKCPYHNKEADENETIFANELLLEVMGEKEGTEHYPYFNKPKEQQEPTPLFLNPVYGE